MNLLAGLAELIAPPVKPGRLIPSAGEASGSETWDLATAFAAILAQHTEQAAVVSDTTTAATEPGATESGAAGSAAATSSPASVVAQELGCAALFALSGVPVAIGSTQPAPSTATASAAAAWRRAYDHTTPGSLPAPVPATPPPAPTVDPQAASAEPAATAADLSSSPPASAAASMTAVASVPRAATTSPDEAAPMATNAAAVALPDAPVGLDARPAADRSDDDNRPPPSAAPEAADAPAVPADVVSASGELAAALAPAGADRASVVRTLAVSPDPNVAVAAGESDVQPAEIRRQVITGLMSQLGAEPGKERVVLQLEPQHLGRVEVSLVARGDRLEIVFRAETSQTEQALADSAQDLVEALLGGREGRWQAVDIKVTRQDEQRERDPSRQRGEERGSRDKSDGDQHQHRRDERSGARAGS